MHIADFDLNLLRVFDAIYSTRSVSRAAEELNLAQPVVSQRLARLRGQLDDALFERTSGGVRPSMRAERMAPIVRAALAMLEQTLTESGSFQAAAERRRFRVHMSDIGQGHFLPRLMVHLRKVAPGVGLDIQHLEPAELSHAMDIGKIDFAFGFLPQLHDMRRFVLLSDYYLVLVRKSHPFAQLTTLADIHNALPQLEYIGVRTHADTIAILQKLRLEDQLRLTVEQFNVLPSIVRETDLAAIIPNQVASTYSPQDYAVVNPHFPDSRFEVHLHWNKRFENDAGNRWFREQVAGLFCSEPAQEASAPRAAG